jgi:hypothetical protein
LRLIAELEALAGAQESLFRAQLLREDVARLRKLRDLAQAAEDCDTFAAAARRLGWTQGDQRTHELKPELDVFLAAVYEQEKGAAGEEAEARLRRAWEQFTRARMEKLVGCLSTPVPRPDPE